MARRGETLTVAQVCALVRELQPGSTMQPSTWRGYVSRGMPRGNPAPKPDGQHDARTPWWWERTVREWVSRRPSATPGADA